MSSMSVCSCNVHNGCLFGFLTADGHWPIFNNSLANFCAIIVIILWQRRLLIFSICFFFNFFDVINNNMSFLFLLLVRWIQVSNGYDGGFLVIVMGFKVFISSNIDEFDCDFESLKLLNLFL